MTIINWPNTPTPMDTFPVHWRPYSNITPFTYSDGMTYLEFLESLRAWLRDRLIPHIDTELNSLSEQFVVGITDLTSAVNDALAEQNTYVLAQLNNAVEAVINSSIEVSDPVIMGVLNNATSAVRAFLDSHYAPKVGISIADYPNLKAAISALPNTGGTIFVPRGLWPVGDWTYDTNYMNKANVSIVGEKRPVPSGNLDRLTDGSILYGRFNVFADNFSVENVGFDMGKYIVDTYFGGADTHSANHPLTGGWDAFAFATPPEIGMPARRNVRINNIIGLLRDSQTFGHAVLMEDIANLQGDEIIGIGGIHATVIKSSYVQIGRIAGYCASANNHIIKSDPYSIAGQIQIDSITVMNKPFGLNPWYAVATTGSGVRINPQDAPNSGPIEIGKILAYGTECGLVFGGNANDSVADVSIGSLIADGYGGSMDYIIGDETVSLRRIKIGTLTGNNARNGIIWASPTIDDTYNEQLSIGSASFVNIKGGTVIGAGTWARLKFGTLEVSDSDTVYQVDDSARLFIGKELLHNVVTKWGRTPPGLVAGWANFGGTNSGWSALQDAYGVSLKGLIKASAGATGIVASVPPYLRPTEVRRFIAYRKTAAGNGFCLISVDINGNIYLDDNTNPATGDYISLDGIKWALD